MNKSNCSKQHKCPDGRSGCSAENGFCGTCIEKLPSTSDFLDSIGDKSAVDVHSRQKFSSDSLAKPVICELCKESCGSNERCEWCNDFLKSFETGGGDVPPSMPRPEQTSKLVARGGSGGGRADDFISLQGFLSEEICEECGKTVGSNPLRCVICASIFDSPLNPAQPLIHYDKNFGPAEGSFGPCTTETTRRTLEAFKRSFETSKKGGFPITRIYRFKRRASLIRGLLSNGTILGIEGFNNSCYYVVVFWMLSQGNMQERINTDCLSGNILWNILCDLRERLFVRRDDVEAFRLSLRECPLVQRSKSDFEQGMDDFSYLLGLLEDDEVGILRKGPIFSHTGCSFHVHESTAVKHASIQEALCASVSSPSPVPENGSIISFEFCKQKNQKNQKNNRSTTQILGTDFEFPRNGVILGVKLLRPKMFIIYKSQHYLVVLCVGESYFLANSISASQCGHFLPEMREISEQEAMELFRTQAHTIVFECVGNAYAPPIQPPSAQSDWVPPPPPPAPCAQSDWVPPPPPPPQVPCLQVAPALPPTPPAQSQHVININVLCHFIDPRSGMSKWSVSVVDPQDPAKMIFEEIGVCVESTNQSGVFLYTFDSDPSEPKKYYKQSKEVNNFIKELNKRFNERSK